MQSLSDKYSISNKISIIINFIIFAIQIQIELSI